MVDVRELITYNEDVRRRYLTKLAEPPWEEVVKNREVSWHSIRNIFVHTLNAVNYWLDFLLNEGESKLRRISTLTEA